MSSSRSSRSTVSSGLPSGPRASSTTRSNHGDRPLRSQKSLASMSRSPRPRSPSRSRPPVPSSRTSNDRTRTQPEYRRSDDSASSASSIISSSASSIFDRIKAGTGYASSRTSFEDDEPAPKKTAPPSSLRERRQARSTASDARDTNHDSYDGDGSTVWAKMATAASTLTVSVGKAWATNVTTMLGEETPEGGETRLTKALRAYHLAKAQDPRDLPDWLFEPHERQVRSRMPTVSREEDEYSDRPEKMREPPRSKGLRDIYASAASSVPAVQADKVRERPRISNDGPSTNASKATDRLRAMRDAKRGALTRDSNAGHDADSYEGGAGRTQWDQRRDEPPGKEVRRPAARVGLPSGPSGRVRRV